MIFALMQTPLTFSAESAPQTYYQIIIACQIYKYLEKLFHDMKYAKLQHLCCAVCGLSALKVLGVFVVWCGVLSEIEWLALGAGVLISLLGWGLVLVGRLSALKVWLVLGVFGGRPFKCVLGLCVGVRLVAFAVGD